MLLSIAYAVNCPQSFYSNQNIKLDSDSTLSKNSAAEDYMDNVAKNAKENVASNSKDNVAATSEDNVTANSEDNVAATSEDNVAANSEDNEVAESKDNVAANRKDNVVSGRKDNAAGDSESGMKEPSQVKSGQANKAQGAFQSGKHYLPRVLNVIFRVCFFS